MTLSIRFPDKYRLWTELIRGQTDRLFVPTDDTVSLGTPVRLEVALPDLALPITVEGMAVGRRKKSRRFPGGVYLRFAASEIEKCRRFLGLLSISDGQRKARKARRVPAELEVRFVQPSLAAPCASRNLSKTGMLCTLPSVLVQGQRVELVLVLPDGEAPVAAEVMWVSSERPLVGLRFLEMSEGMEKRISAAVDSYREAELQRPPPVGGPVVVADDDPDILAFLGKALSSHGYKVYQAGKGDEALGLIRELQPVLVLLDVLMPGVDGSDVVRIMRADEELWEIPVVFVSALDAEELHTVADEAGASDYVTKPVDVGELINLVGGYLQDHA